MSKQYPTGPLDRYFELVSDLEQFRSRYQPQFDTLTAREAEVLTCIAEGHSNPDIANLLSISRSTVQNHRARVRDKLQIDNQTDYIKIALAFGLIEF
jgi:DNA-binding NarL/FixJ family response regulator